MEKQKETEKNKQKTSVFRKAKMMVPCKIT